MVILYGYAKIIHEELNKLIKFIPKNRHLTGMVFIRMTAMEYETNTHKPPSCKRLRQASWEYVQKHMSEMMGSTASLEKSQYNHV